MSTGYTSGKERRHTAEIFRDNWLWLVLERSEQIVFELKLKLQSFVFLLPCVVHLCNFEVLQRKKNHGA